MNGRRISELVPATTRLAEANGKAGDRVALLAATETNEAVVTTLQAALTAVAADVTTLTVVPNRSRNRSLRPIVAGAIDRADVVVNCGATSGFPPELLEFTRAGNRHLKAPLERARSRMIVA